MVVLGYLPIHRSLSFRVGKRSITHLLTLIGPDCSLETYLQALGRGTGELKHLLVEQTRGAVDYVTVLTEEFDLMAAKRFFHFQLEVVNRMRGGWVEDEGVRHPPCDLKTALQGRFEPFMNFMLCRIGRKGKLVRRIGLRGYDFELQLVRPDEMVAQAHRSRRVDAAHQLLPLGVENINMSVAALKDHQDPFDIRRVASVGQVEISEAMEGPVVVANELRLIPLRAVLEQQHELEGMPSTQQEVAACFHKSHWVKKALQDAMKESHGERHRTIKYTGAIVRRCAAMGWFVYARTIKLLLQRRGATRGRPS